jgi:hypothetical protein
MSDPGFPLNVVLSRPDVVEWLRVLPEDQLGRVVENTLAAGNLVLSLLQASAGEESMRRFFRPVADRMDELKATLETMLRATKVSARQGDLGENIAIEQLKRAFPGDGFEPTGNLDHQADICACFRSGLDEPRKAFIEVKLYTHDVPGAEVQKFRRDLEENGIRYGLMVSMTSAIAGVGGPLHLEEFGEHLIVYAPRAGLDGYGLVCGAMLLKAIVAYEAEANATGLVRAGAVEAAWRRLNAELRELDDVCGEIREVRDLVREAQSSMGRLFDVAVDKAIGAEIRLRHALNRVACRLTEELTELCPGDDGPNLPAATQDDVLEFMHRLEAKNDQRLAAFRGIYDLAGRFGIEITLDGNHWRLSRKGVHLARTGGAKSRLDVLVAFDPEQPLQLLSPAVEKVRDKEACLEINGSDPRTMLELLAKRWQQSAEG